MNIIELVRNGHPFTNQLTNAPDNQISEYKVITDNKVYTLSREQVELFYRGYSGEGYNLSTRDLCTFFPLFNANDMSHIRQAFSNAFGFRKEDTIITPHEIEENTIEELKEIIQEFILNKKVLAIKNSVPSTLNKVIEKQRAEIDKLKDYKTLIEEGFKDIPLTPLQITQTFEPQSIAIWISDMHIGCKVTSSGATMHVNVGWNNDMVIERLNRLIGTIRQLGKFNEIWVFNLGDAIDGMDHTTSRREQNLPQNMSNSEMATYYREDINYLFDTMIANNMANSYHFRTVSQSNHGGDFEALASAFLVEQLKHKGIDAYMPETAFGTTNISGTTIVYGHGKDNLYQSKPLSNVLDNRTKSYIDSLIRAKGLSSYFGNILVVKGDSHQYSLTGCADYNYLSVGSLFGSSEWAQSNFPHRGWEINYTIFNSNTLMHGSVKDNNPYSADIQFD